MMARTLYLPADTTINLTAARTIASQLAQQATVEDLRTLLEHGWIVDDTIPHPDSCSDDELAAHTGHLRQLAEQQLSPAPPRPTWSSSTPATSAATSA
jgi:hypothetical protein